MPATAQTIGIAFLTHGLIGYISVQAGLWLMLNKTNAISLERMLPEVLSEQTLAGFIRQGVSAVESSLKTRKTIRQLYQLGDAVIPTLLADFIGNTLGDLEHGKNRHLKELLQQVYARALPKLKLDYTEAEFAVSAVFSTLVTPAYVRKTLADSLTPTRIEDIEQSVLSQMPFWQGLFARFIDIKRPLAQLREFLINKPVEAEQVILDLSDQLEVREHLTEALAGFTPGALDEPTQDALVRYLTSTTTELLIDNRHGLAGVLQNLSNRSTRVLSKALIKADYKKWLVARYPKYDEAIARWVSARMAQQVDLNRFLPALMKPLSQTLSLLVAIISGLLGILARVIFP